MQDELRTMIEDVHVPDGDVAAVLLQRLKDRFDRQGTIVSPTDDELEEIEEVRTLVSIARPAVFKEVEKYVRSRFSKWELMKYTARMLKKKIL